MIEGINLPSNLDPLQRQALQTLSRNSWAILPTVATDSSKITRDTLPNGYAQYYINGSETRLYFNINNSITSISNSEFSLDGKTEDSVEINSDGNIQLVNDLASPGNSMYYGTDSSGNRGWLSTGAFQSSQFYTSNATYTAIANYAFVTLCGGGGGGAGPRDESNGGGGGGGGGAAIRSYLMDLVQGNSYQVIVGAAGAGGVGYGAAGSSGGSSSFNTLGVGGGSGGASGAGGAGGKVDGTLSGTGLGAITASMAASWYTPGPQGAFCANGGNGGNPNSHTGGAGGASIYGPGASHGATPTRGYGGGGGGSSNFSGGYAGKQGFVFVTI